MLTELFAAIAADPSAVPLWAVVAFAVGMYPVGFMLGAPCSPCCAACPCAEGEELPETVTVTLDGFTDKSPGPNLCNLSFSACFGSGAAGHVTAPGGDPATDAGPVSAVTLDDAGSGYAKFGRVAPTLEASGSGSGAEFVVTVTQSQNECGVDEWAISKVEITKGGTGYVDDEQLTFTVAEGDTIETAATVRLKTERIEPTATIEVASQEGTGAELEVVFSSLAGSPPSWKIDSVTVVDGGDLYVTGDTPTLTLGADTLELSPASFFVKAAHVEPTVSAVVNSSTGSGAAVSVTLTPFVAADVSDVWAVDAITVDAPGTGYQEWDGINVEVVDGIARLDCAAYVDAVDANGAIQSVAIGPGQGGEYLKGGPITEVVVDPHGQYYGNSGVADSVEIDNGGVYYREDESLPPYVAEVSVAITQTLPSAGSGAEISATVNEDKESPDFGKIESLSIDNGGGNYLAWEWQANDCCGVYLNRKPIVLSRDGCVYSHTECGGYYSPGYNSPLQHTVIVEYKGATVPPTAKLMNGACAAASVAFTTETLITKCSEFAFSAASENGQTISVEPGGGYYDPPSSYDCCHPCCRRDETPPEEIALNVVWANDLPPTFYTRFSNYLNFTDGTYVLARTNGGGCLTWSGGGFAVSLETCDVSCQQCVKKCKVTISHPFLIVVLRGMGNTDWSGPYQPLQDERFLSLPALPPSVEPTACGEECVDACITSTPSCSPVSETEYKFGFWAYNELYSVAVGNWLNIPWWLQYVRGGYSGDPCQFANGYYEWMYSQVPCNGGCDGPFEQCCQAPAPWDQNVTLYNPLEYFKNNPNYAQSWYGRTGGGNFTNRTQAGYEEFMENAAGGFYIFAPTPVPLPKSFRWSGIVTLTISDAQ
jgi:hypothetical protein